ncbi:unnamed protein product, partial [Darwinula stevensoni]
IYGISARNLQARSGSNTETFALLDAQGCPTEPDIFPEMRLDPVTKSLFAEFEAFKFSNDAVVRFLVTVQFCLEECPPARCGHSDSYGRRRKRATYNQKKKAEGRARNKEQAIDSKEYRAEEEEEEEEEEMEEDPVVYHVTPLQKEIIVDGTFISPLNDSPAPLDVQSGSVGGEEVVCTTKPVVIAAVVSTAILQLCILAVCLMCIHVHRGKRKDGEMLHTSSELEITYGSTTGLPTSTFAATRRPIRNPAFRE